GDLNVTLSGANATGFTLSKTTINSITDTDSTDTFTVKPNTGLDAGTYTATVTVTGMNIVSRSFDVSFTVSSAATYTVKFNANGGSGTMADMTVNVGAHTALAENSFTRAGYEFIGWNDQSDGSGTNYADKDSVPTANAGESITLYAKWVHGKVSDDAAHVSGIEADGLNEVAKEEKTDITLVVQDEAETKDDAEQGAIKASAGAPKKFGFYDIRLEKSTGGTVENSSSVIEIKLPYDFTKKIISESIADNNELMKMTRDCMYKMIKCAEKYISEFREYINRTISEQELVSNTRMVASEIRKLFFQQSDFSIASNDLHEWQNAFANLAAVIDDFVLCYDSNSMNNRDSKNRMQLFELTIDRYNKSLEIVKQIDSELAIRLNKTGD
ncbi:InlB B-repeat-containing protein, partial [uncultured Ruminococcus sp.]|uniref:InlB B-repeat-containing protein n=1 Tax=uncultured Ruminococcus sp. TaxID=165186 RepID=UPI0025F74147